ncbi:S1 family peptidase [Rubritalea tangerina]
MQDSLKQVKESCVAVSNKGTGSGVIISPGGYVISAAHMFRNLAEEPTPEIILHDGRKLKAQLLGFNRESDFALLKISDPKSEDWPHCTLAKSAPTTGNYCFTIAHPSGYLEGRPAQARLGRITSHSQSEDGSAYYLFADCNIQPGDSGGPLFSLDGKLIGMDSSAAGLLGFNIFPAIDQFHKDRPRLTKGERWGDAKNAPDGEAITSVTLDAETLNQIQQTFMQRVQQHYPPTVDFLQELADENGEVRIDQQKIAMHMLRDAMAISRKQPISHGLDDPAHLAQLPKLPTDAKRNLLLHPSDQPHQPFAHGIALDSQFIVCKHSLLPQESQYSAKIGPKHTPLKLVATDPTWDIALLKAKEAMPFPPMTWPTKALPVGAGSLLLAPDHKGRPVWNVATDSPRVVSKKRSIGPLDDKTIISKHRAPYPTAIRHALPLYADDAGTPIFSQDGSFVGIHIARFSRTFGLIIPSSELQKSIQKMQATLD